MSTRSSENRYSNSSGATITKTNGTGVITNDDFALIYISPVSLSEGSSGTTPAGFQIRMSKPVDQPVSVIAATTDGTATVSSGDYVQDIGTMITFPSGSVGPFPYNVTINGDTTPEPDETFTVNLTPPTTGFPYSAVSQRRSGAGLIRNDDNAAGSVLVFPYYTSSADATSNTTFRFTNNSAQAALLRLFFVTNSCTKKDIYLPIAPNGCASVSASAVDPAQTGSIIAVAVGSDGKPIQKNSLTGRATLNDGDYQGSYDAEIFRAVSATPATINSDGTATLNFDGNNYDQVPNQFTASIQSPLDAVGQKIITSGMVGNLSDAIGLSGAKQVGVGVLYGSIGSFGSFTGFLNGTCQSSPTITTRIPRVPGGMDRIVPSGQTGVFDLLRIDGGVGILLTPQTAPGGAKIQPLQKTNFVSTTLTIPAGTPPATTLPTLSINNVSVVEGNSGTTNAVFTVTLQDAQFSCAPITVNYSVPASAGNDYIPTSGSLTFTPSSGGGTFTQFITVLVNGDTAQEGNEQFTVTLSNPSGAIIGNSVGTGTILDDDVSTLSINDVTIAEGNNGISNAVFTVNLSPAAPTSVTVNYTTINGSATSPDNDFLAVNGTLTFPANTTSQTITVPINGDNLVEATENFLVRLSNPTGAIIGDSDGVGTITNDDSATLSINDVTVPEGSSGTSLATFTLTLSNPVASTVVGTAIAIGSSATSSQDFNALPLSFTFNPGERSKTITVQVIGDNLVEATETFSVILNAPGLPSEVTILKGTGTGTIPNDDFALIEIDKVNITETNSGSVTATFHVSMSNPVDQLVSLNYATADGSATTTNSDYNEKNGSIFFPANSNITQSIEIMVMGDTTTEINETFKVLLSSTSLPSAVKIATDPDTGTTIPGIGTIINDDENTVPSTTTTIVPLAEDVTTTFSSVTSGGVTVVTPAAPPPPANLPPGYTGFTIGTQEAVSLAYEITTTATFPVTAENPAPIVVTFKAPGNITLEQFNQLST